MRDSKKKVFSCSFSCPFHSLIRYCVLAYFVCDRKQQWRVNARFLRDPLSGQALQKILWEVYKSVENWPKPKNYQEEVAALACAFFYDDDDDDTANVMCSSSIIKLESDHSVWMYFFNVIRACDDFFFVQRECDSNQLFSPHFSRNNL